MIASCQFCKQMIVGPDSNSLDVEARRAYEYRQLSMLVSGHMTQAHPGEVGNEVMYTVAMAGAAVAMRFVTASDPLVDEWRGKTGRALMELFEPAPHAPIQSAGDQATAAVSPVAVASSEAP